MTVAPTADAIRVGFVGAGNYATSMLLPHLAKNPQAALVSVATTRSLSAVNAQRKFGFDRASTSSEDVLADDSLDAIFVVTRHHSHAALVCRALETGKAVFVEKPLALSTTEVERILETVAATGNDRLMVGFNRRFAPLFAHIQQVFGPVDAPVCARYLVNAGGLDAQSWYLNEKAEGSRFVGEAGHFIDTLTAFVGHPVTDVFARKNPMGDITADLGFEDGSMGSLAYLIGGSSRFSKETLDVNGGGRTARLDNFVRAALWSGKGKTTRRSFTGPDKGQQAQVEAFLAAVRSGGPMPILLDSLIATTRATLGVEESATTGRPVKL